MLLDGLARRHRAMIREKRFGSTELRGICDMGEPYNLARRIERDRYQIDSPNRVADIGVVGQIPLRRRCQLTGLRGRQRFFGASSRRTGSCLYLDEHELVTVPHDRVELAGGTTPITLDQPKAAPLQRFHRQRFRLSSQQEVRRDYGRFRHSRTGLNERRW